jgi:hypothetical protein
MLGTKVKINFNVHVNLKFVSRGSLEITTLPKADVGITYFVLDFGQVDTIMLMIMRVIIILLKKMTGCHGRTTFPRRRDKVCSLDNFRLRVYEVMYVEDCDERNTDEGDMQTIKFKETNLGPHHLEEVHILPISLIHNTVHISSTFIHGNHGNSILLLGTTRVGNQQRCHMLFVHGSCWSIIGRRGSGSRDGRRRLLDIDVKITRCAPSLFCMELEPRDFVVVKDVVTPPAGMGSLNLKRDGFIRGNGETADVVLVDISIDSGRHRESREDGK